MNELPYLNGITLGGYTIIDRWQPKDSRDPRLVKRPHGALADCLWCCHQMKLADQGKKSKPLAECPWLNWTPLPPPSRTIPAAERWELMFVKSEAAS